jgi:bla regulator protein BlaR1
MSLADLSLLANHLWQSTLCVAAVWLLTLVLKKNQTAVRYWLGLVASVKFLIPFSLLVSVGSQIGWQTAPAIVQPQWSVVLADLGRPFAISAPALQAVTPPASDPVPAILFSVWFCGFAASITMWLRGRPHLRIQARARTALLPVLSDPRSLPYSGNNSVSGWNLGRLRWKC